MIKVLERKFKADYSGESKQALNKLECGLHRKTASQNHWP